VVVTGTEALASPWDDVSIGRPITGTRCYVLDRYANLVPDGVAGELCVGGAGVARGYVGRPSTTAERFTPDPFGAPGERMYHTGDLVRWRADGALAFLGRIDRQIKLRGYRIEPGEVEAVLLGYPGVREAAVEARRGALVAYVATTRATAAELREHVARSLPEHLVPAVITTLPRLPLTTSGKIDRRALPEPAPSRPLDGPAEHLVAGIWGELLGASPTGADDDFFALGGHSLLAARLATLVSEACDVDVPVRAVFDHRTVAAYAAEVEARVVAAVAAMSEAEVADELRRTGEAVQ
jgi:hypothetical protein